MSTRSLILAAALATTALGGRVAARASDSAPVPADSAFVALDAIEVPIAGTQRIEGVLRANLVIAAPGGDAAAAVDARMPEVRAAALSAMIEYSRLYASGLTAVDAAHLRADLTRALRRVDARIATVLITEVAATRA